MNALQTLVVQILVVELLEETLYVSVYQNTKEHHPIYHALYQ